MSDLIGLQPNAHSDSRESDKLRVIFDGEPKTSSAVAYDREATTREEILKPLTERERIAIVAIISAMKELVILRQQSPGVDTTRVGNHLFMAYGDITGRRLADDYDIWK